jgi:hypothetical protein
MLLMQAGWVVTGLIAIAHLPVKPPQAPPLPAAKPTPAVRPSIAAPAQSKPRSVTALVSQYADLFAGASDSLVARTVGHAEGTRNPDGSKTSAYFGHVDPGNGVWNLGSFSFQHCNEPAYACSTPEEADVHQLQRLQTQTEQLQARSTVLQLRLTVEEALNGIDLTNQAPLAVLNQPGYPEYLAQAKEHGLRGQDAILEARVWSYWNPATGAWDAPGLGNQEDSIRHDQRRRMLAIARVLAVYNQTVPEQSTHRNHLNVTGAVNNPYAFKTQRSHCLWWDSGYWDSKLNRGRQVPQGYEPSYDEGFSAGERG